MKTILSQGHLTPLPLYVSPVFWAYDYSLRVYPVPDVIIFADKYDPFSIKNTDCLCVNPVRNRSIHYFFRGEKYNFLSVISLSQYALMMDLSIIYFYRAHSPKVASHLRCITHPAELLKTGGMFFRFHFSLHVIYYRLLLFKISY